MPPDCSWCGSPTLTEEPHEPGLFACSTCNKFSMIVDGVAHKSGPRHDREDVRDVRGAMMDRGD